MTPAEALKWAYAVAVKAAEAMGDRGARLYTAAELDEQRRTSFQYGLEPGRREVAVSYAADTRMNRDERGRE